MTFFGEKDKGYLTGWLLSQEIEPLSDYFLNYTMCWVSGSHSLEIHDSLFQCGNNVECNGTNTLLLKLCSPSRTNKSGDTARVGMGVKGPSLKRTSLNVFCCVNRLG